MEPRTTKMRLRTEAGNMKIYRLNNHLIVKREGMFPEEK
jgi:hypothetical protein